MVQFSAEPSGWENSHGGIQTFAEIDWYGETGERTWRDDSEHPTWNPYLSFERLVVSVQVRMICASTPLVSPLVASSEVAFAAVVLW